MNPEEIFGGLNDAQMQAVLHPVGKPAMVLAGAGSGKTKVLTTRAVYLMQQESVRPDRILLVTFTNKASNEMVERVTRMTGNGLPFAGTFHRLCARFLRAQGRVVGVSPDYTIYDEDDQMALMTAIIKDLGLSTKEVKPRAILSMISAAKNELIGPSEYSNMARGKYQEMAARLYPLYQKRLERSGALDFDDLMMKTIDLMVSSDQVRDYYQEQFEHVLIDEYQDTNTAQYTLTKLLTKPQMNLFVVGDFSQAIYGWRGADYRNMLSLTQDFPEIVTYRLEQNYRSTQSILDAASGVIANNTSHPVLDLWTQKQAGEKVIVFEAGSDRDEVSYVVSQIRKYAASYSLSDIAILYRTNAQSRAFEEELIRVGLPYRLVGGVRFYERKEIKDILSLLRLFNTRTDEMAFKRVEKMGKRKLANYLTWLDNNRDKLLEKAVGEEAAEKQPKTTALTLLDAILQATDYLAQYNENDEEDQARLENIAELRSLAAQFPDVTSLLETVSLVEQEAMPSHQAQQQEALSLMSVHAAKGLEFAIVFLVGMEEGLFPHSRSLLDRLQMEEERRLCYVAITRAKEKLYITYARRRMVFGTVSGSIISRFISEIPMKALQREGGGSFTPSHNFKPKTKTTDSSPRFVPYDDPSIDDFLSGSLDIETFLNS